MLRKHEHLNLYRQKFNQVNNVRKTIGQRWTDAWDSCPNKVWRIFEAVRANCPPYFLKIEQEAHRVEANCLRKLFSIGFIGVGA